MPPITLVLRVLLLFPLLFFSCLFVPGYFVVRRFPLNAAERVTCSVGVSIFMIYVYALLIYVAKLPQGWSMSPV